MESLGIVPFFNFIEYSILLPSRDELHPTCIVLACTVQVDETVLYADLIVIPMVYFDVILCMDWLYSYGAVIDCEAKVLSFPLERKRGDVIDGSGTSLRLSFYFLSCG